MCISSWSKQSITYLMALQVNDTDSRCMSVVSNYMLKLTLQTPAVLFEWNGKGSSAYCTESCRRHLARPDSQRTHSTSFSCRRRPTNIRSHSLSV